MEKRKPKRMALSIITFLLSCVLCMASYAGVAIDPSALSGNAASGGSFMSSGGSSGDLSETYGRYMNYPQNCGYRIAVVDTEGYAVTNIIDAVNYCPKDLVENGGGSYTMDANGGDVTDIRANYNQYEKYVGMLEPSDGGKNTNFYYSVGVKTEPYGKGERFTRGITTGLGKYTSEVYGGTVNAYMYPMAVLKQYVHANAITAAAAGDPPLPAPDISLFQFPLPITMVSSKNSWGVIANGGRLKAMLDAHVDPADETSTTLSSLLIQTTVPYYDGRGDLYNEGEYRDIFEFIDGVPAKEKMNTTKSDGSAYSIVDAIKEYDYKVVVEPIFWHVMILDEYDPAAASHVSAVGQTRYVLYGTASYMLGDTFKELTEDTGFDALVLNHAVSDWSNICAGFGWSTLYTGLTTLEVERADPELQIRIPALETVGDTPYYNLASTAVEDNYRHSGYGCFIYDAEGLFGDPEGTHTWDSNTYPEESYEPGPAPEVPTEEQGTGKSKQNIIVKYYAHKTDSGYTYIRNFNRDNTISPIDIEDEPKFKVDGWIDPIVSI